MKLGILQSLIQKNDNKIIFVVMDGLGGHPMSPGGKTELETASTPNLDRYAAEGICGMMDPVTPGITPGSGPGHLGVFGYDPLENLIGRGVLSALGIDFDLTHRDVAARLNFCTLDATGKITDRRAGRIATELNRRLCQKIRDNVRLADGVEYFLETESEHRAVLIIRGDGLAGNINDTDPQILGVAPVEAKGADQASEKTATYFRDFLTQVGKLLADESPANMVLARGFATRDPLPTFEEKYGLKAAAIAQYPMYRGLARLVGMNVLEKPPTYADMLEQLKLNYNNYDFFFVHFKKTDSTGEDGNFDEKVKKIEEIDGWVAGLRDLSPTVLVVTGDHSTPSYFKAHSWHPVPTLLWSQNCRRDLVQGFGESNCTSGAIGRMPMKHLIMLALANALKLKKFGA